MKICVIGAGVIGLTTACFLAQRGYEVTVVEGGSSVGHGTSLSNGGQLSYSYVAPLADPSVWKNIPHYLFHPQSPLSLRPALDPEQWGWLLRFLMACNAKASKHATAELLRLAFFSRDCMAALQRELDLAFNHREAGKLVMFDTAPSLEAARRQVDLQRAMGCGQDILNADQCLELEPALAASRQRWAGGVYTRSEQVGDCHEFCVQLANAMKVGGHRFGNMHFLFDTDITGAIREGNRIMALTSSRGEIAADAFVLANGVGATRLARQCGFTVPVYPLKGYSITLRSRCDTVMPSISITDYSRKIVYARIGDALRVAGRVEIVGHDLAVDTRHCNTLADQAGILFPHIADDRSNMSPWAGLRPATPTGIPIIGRAPIPNLYLNVGHGALGWTLACGSAALLASQIEGKPCEIDGSAFACAA